MKAALVAALLAGCVTAEGVWKANDTTVPMLAGATAADLVVIGVIAKEGDGLTTGASIATALAVTAVDVFLGCLLGACHSLRL